MWFQYTGSVQLTIDIELRSAEAKGLSLSLLQLRRRRDCYKKFRNSGKRIGLLNDLSGGIDIGLLNEEQSLDLTDSNERVVYVDGNGTKVADSDKKLALNTSESFSELEEVRQTPMLVSYYPVDALQNTWAVLWMQPLVCDVMDNATMTTSALNSASRTEQQSQISGFAH